MATETLPPLCPPCQDASNRWLDYRLPKTPGFAHGSGAPYDVSAAGLRDHRKSRFEEWKATIKSNRDLIARTCREQGHADTVVEPVPVVVEVSLFDLIDERQAA